MASKKLLSDVGAPLRGGERRALVRGDERPTALRGTACGFARAEGAEIFGRARRALGNGGTIAFRVAIDVLRGRSRVLFWDEDDLAKELDRESGDAPTDQRLVALRDERAAREKVKAALDRIHPRYARVIQLRLLDEEPREDAARILGVTLATFDVLLHRSIQALKKDLAAHERE